jgi:hypothetical protein
MFTSIQQKQMQFLQKMEPHETLTSGRKYFYDCETCNEHKECNAACTVIDFLYQHVGHKTWVKTRR